VFERPLGTGESIRRCRVFFVCGHLPGKRDQEAEAVLCLHHARIYVARS
jgi:hypothetical protein